MNSLCNPALLDNGNRFRQTKGNRRHIELFMTDIAECVLECNLEYKPEVVEMNDASPGTSREKETDKHMKLYRYEKE